MGSWKRKLLDVLARMHFVENPQHFMRVINQCGRSMACGSGFVCRHIQHIRSPLAAHSRMRLDDKIIQTFAEPVIAPGVTGFVVHALLDDGPRTVRGEYKQMMIELKAVLQSGIVNFGGHAAGKLQIFSRHTQSVLVDGGGDFMRRSPGRLALAAGKKQAQISLPILQTFFERSADNGR